VDVPVRPIDGFFPPIPSESLAIALAALSISSGKPNLALIIMVASAGAFTGNQIAYTIGKRLDVGRIPFLAGPRGRKTLDWARWTLARRGASFILAGRFIPVGRVAVNMTAGAVGYARRRFVLLAAIASISWALYSAAIGIGAGEWFNGHPFGAIVVGVVAGLLIGLVLDRTLRRLAYRQNRTAGSTDPASVHTGPAGWTRRRLR
jgi:membrane-associated protein